MKITPASKVLNNLPKWLRIRSRLLEIHGEKIEEVTKVLDKKSLKWKQTGG